MQTTAETILVADEYGVTGDRSETIARLADQPFRMVFVDIKMRFMDAVETYRRIRKINPEAVVLMMAACAIEELLLSELEYGACWVIREPLCALEVSNVIEEAKSAQGGGLILVVDGTPGTYAALQNILHSGSYEVEVVHTCMDAIAAVEKGTYGACSLM